MSLGFLKLSTQNYSNHLNHFHKLPNQKNAIKRNELKNKLKLEGLEINSKPSIEEAIKSIPIKDNEIILITGSLYLAGEVLNQN